MSPTQERLRRFFSVLGDKGNAPTATTGSQPFYSGSTWDHLVQDREPIQWDWPGWLPHGFLVIVASEPGVGKSSLCLRLAASYGDGWPWPDGSPFTAQRGKTLWCESEDGHEANLDRLLAWGLDPSQLVNPLANVHSNFKLDNPSHLKNLLIYASRSDIRLVVCDSLSGLHNHPGSPRAMRSVVAGLANIARAIGKPILLTHHLRKRTTFDRDNYPSLDRLLGSSAIAQVPRVIWTLDIPDLADRNNRRLMVIKNNLASFPDPLGFTISDQGLHFGPSSQAVLTTYSELDRAATLLSHLLANGPLPATQVTTQAQAAGLSPTTLKRAKKQLRIKSHKLPGQWVWQLPPPDKPPQ